MKFRPGAACLLALPLLAAEPASSANAADEHAHHHAVAPAAATDEHAQHMAMMAAPTVQVSRHQYEVPAASLVDNHGKAVDLRALLAGNRPVILNFIYTSCTTICPVMTASLLQLQRSMAKQSSGARPLYVSLSVDPDFDSPKVLQDYAGRFGAEWTFLTGPHDVVLDVLRNFDAWRGTKANHAAVTLMRPAGSQEWTRVEGLASANDLATIWSDIAR